MQKRGTQVFDAYVSGADTCPACGGYMPEGLPCYACLARTNELKEESDVKNDTYYHGVEGSKWGIYNTKEKRFEPGISEDTPMLAVARMFQKIGDQARMKKYLPKQLPRKDERVYA